MCDTGLVPRSINRTCCTTYLLSQRRACSGPSTSCDPHVSRCAAVRCHGRGAAAVATVAAHGVGSSLVTSAISKCLTSCPAAVWGAGTPYVGAVIAPLVAAGGAAALSAVGGLCRSAQAADAEPHVSKLLNLQSAQQKSAPTWLPLLPWPRTVDEQRSWISLSSASATCHR
jgi:hypothetical protein